jgi:hypothetical protein
MGGGADGTVIAGQVVQGMVMVGDCRIGNEKNQKHGNCQRKSFVYDFASHTVYFKQQINFVNSLSRKLPALF